VQDKTPLHRERSSAREMGFGVRFRGVVSAERYAKSIILGVE
jgi:hypothetical protein